MKYVSLIAIALFGLTAGACTYKSERTVVEKPAPASGTVVYAETTPAPATTTVVVPAN